MRLILDAIAWLGGLLGRLFFCCLLVIGFATALGASAEAMRAKPQSIARLAPADLPKDPLELLALMAWAEARSEGEEGMRWVMHVALNRLRSGHYGDTLQDVILQPQQFSAFNEGIPEVNSDQTSWLVGLTLARQVLLEPDPTKGALFYHTSECDSLGCTRMRQYGVRPTKFGAHIFYNGMEKRNEVLS